MTGSRSPFSDEGFSLLNARNFAVLGQWSVDDWNLHLVSAPYSLIHAAVFVLAGPGIIQARLVEIVITALMTALVVVGLRRAVGPGPAVIGGFALGTSALVLYYGRLALLEPLVALGLTACAVFLAIGSDRRPVIAGILAGAGLAVAVGTKLLAIPSAGGLLLAAALVSWRHPPMRLRLIAAVATAAVAALAWLVVIGLAHGAEAAAHVARYPPEPLPADLAIALSRMASYATHSDGALTFAAPLFAGGAVGAVLGLLEWRRLSPAARALLVVAIGWFIAGFVPITLVPYAPNRYVLPSLPPLALIIGVGLQTVFNRDWSGRRAFRTIQVGAITVAISVPGLLSYARWMAHAPTTLPAIQAEVAEAVPSNATVAGGLAPLFAMRTRGPVLFSLFGINQGDLYAEKDVRWVVVGGGAPAWTSVHPDAWARRRLVLSTIWGGEKVVLYRLP